MTFTNKAAGEMLHRADQLVPAGCYRRALIRRCMRELNMNDDAFPPRSCWNVAVINVPSRGIGDTTVNTLSGHAAAQNVSLWTVVEGELAFLSSRAARAVREFREIVHDLQRAAGQPIAELVDYVLLRTGSGACFRSRATCRTNRVWRTWKS